MAATALGFGPGGITASLIVGGLLGAGLAFLLYIAAVFVAGFGFGATLGILLLANFHHMVALLSGCVLGVVGGFLAVKLQRVLIMLSTALLGSFRAMLALAYFTNRIDWLYYFRSPDQLPALIDNHPWMFPAILALAAVGVIAQFELGGSGGDKKKIQGRDRLTLPPLPVAAISGTMKKFLTPFFLVASLALLAGCSSNNSTTAGMKIELTGLARASDGSTRVSWRVVNPNVISYLVSQASHRIYLNGVLI